jgi:hypothetical protein
MNKLDPVNITRIDIGQFCKESYPCQHNCTVYFTDGSHEQHGIDGRTIVTKYLSKLDEVSQRHFDYLINDCFYVSSCQKGEYIELASSNPIKPIKDYITRAINKLKQFNR